MGLQQQGKSIILLPSSSNEEFEDIIQEAHKEQIACYKANQIQKEIFEKILGTNIKSPMYVIISSDTILDIAIYMQNRKPKHILTENKNTTNFFKIEDVIMLKDEVNDTYKKRILWEKVCRKEGVSSERFTVNTISSFYNKYLTSNLLQSANQTDKVHNLLEELWTNFTPEEVHLYKEELFDIMERRKKLASIDPNDIKFNYKQYDFGEIPFKNRLNCSFLYKNMSEYKMIITDISTTCGCIATTWNKGVINPGCTDSIIVTMNINQLGFVTKDILLHFNGKEPIKLKVSANIIERSQKDLINKTE